MKVKSRVTMVLAILEMVMAMVIPAISQEKPSDNMQIVCEKVRADKKLLVAENMQLSEQVSYGLQAGIQKYGRVVFDDRLGDEVD